MSNQSASTNIPVDVVILLEDHADRVHRVRSVLWAASSLIRQAAAQRSTSHSLVVELSQLIETGLRLADDLSDSLSMDRDVAA